MYKVLVVDDEYLMRKALQIVISEVEGFRIVGEAESGRQALEMNEALQPDLIFMDIMIPGISGLEASRQIKQKNPHTSIIVLTAHSNFEFARKAVQIGVKEYLLKPCSQHEIKQIMNRHKETHVRPTYDAEELISKLMEKDFEGARQSIADVVGQLHGFSTNVDVIFREFKKLLSDMLDLVPWMDTRYRASYERKYWIQENVCRDVYLAECWLFDLVDEIFKQRTIQNYPHFIKVFKLLDEQMKGEVSLQSAADYAELSPSYLSRLFKKEFGVTFTNYINYKKMRIAKKLLKYSDMNIIDVAFELGYNEASYFCKVFKSTEGVTPTQYRER